MHTPRGKVLGGSSSINGLVYIRGNPHGFRALGGARARAAGAIATCCRISSAPSSAPRAATSIAAAPGRCRPATARCSNPLHAAWLGRGAQAGYPQTDDVNGFQQEGFGRMDMTVGERPALQRRQRLSAPGDAPAQPQGAARTRSRPACCSRAGALAGSSTAAAGGATASRAARRSSCRGGPINSPQLLKLSGVGPGRGAARARHRGGARPAGRRRESAGSSGVLFPGRLQGADHALFVDQPLEPGADRRALAAAQGRPRRDQSFRDLRLHPQPRRASPIPTSSITSCRWRWPTTARRWRRSTASRRMSGPMRSKSRGWVRLASADPRDKPRILFNYLSHPDDWTEMRACVRLTREIFAQPAFDRYRGREIQPGADVQTRRADRRLHPRQGRERLPSLVLLQDGR